MEQEIKNLIENNYKNCEVIGIFIEKSSFTNDDMVILNCNTTIANFPYIALRILNEYPSVKIVNICGECTDRMYTREILKWAGYKVK